MALTKAERLHALAVADIDRALAAGTITHEQAETERMRLAGDLYNDQRADLRDHMEG